MKEKIRASLLAGGFLVLVSLPVTVLAGGHGAAGAGGHAGAGGGGHRIQTGPHSQATGGMQIRHGLRDGSHADRAKNGIDSMEKKGNAHGPGDGSGPYHPQDGSGYGADTNR